MSLDRSPLLLEFRDKYHLPLSIETLDQATTHDSYLNVDPLKVSNERLEIIGDAVLDLLASDWLYDMIPDGTEAIITQLRSELVDNVTLGKVAKRLDIDTITLAGKGAKINEKQLADSLEAIFGGIFKENNLDMCREIFLKLFAPNLQTLKDNNFQPNLAGKNQNNPKNYLQEWCQARKYPHPRVDLIKEIGDPPKKLFISHYSIEINGMVYSANGKGHSKLASEKRAAEILLKKLQNLDQQ